MIFQHREIVAHFQLHGSVVGPTFVSVSSFQALGAERRTFQTRVAAVVEALLALPPSQLAANNTLTRSCAQNIQSIT